MSQHRRGFAAFACACATMLAGDAARADLDAYVKADDPSFSWKLVESLDTDAGTVHRFDFTSQTWRGGAWKHNLQVYVPKEVKYPDAALLFITGGSTDSKPGPRDFEQGFALAKLCGARVALLPQVPNQPLMGGRKEDDLIAETFTKYLETEDETWPLLFPMAKSAVKAMDAVQAWAKERKQPVERFVVTGASKRGWTTWMTAAVDKRVAGIAPMVIPTLNMKAQNPHQIEVWGKYSEQIEDYTRRGLTEKLDTPTGTRLWKMIDPYTYRDRYTMPKLIINGTNDRYWTLDSLNLFWDDLPAKKWVVYVPNAGHSLEPNRDYATHGIGAFFRHVISGRPMPELSWTFPKVPADRLNLSVTAHPAPKAAKFWAASSPTHDFREAKWDAPSNAGGETMSVSLSRPESRYSAVFGDFTYEIDGLEYHLSTQIGEAPPLKGSP